MTLGSLLVAGAKFWACFCVAWVLALVVVEIVDAQVERWRWRKKEKSE